MARRGDSGGGSSIVLILFLVFFILLSIGLGVSTYLGFSQDDSKDKKIAELTKANKVASDDSDWYKGQALLYRVYMGQTQNLDTVAFGDLRGKLDRGQLTGKEKDEVKALVGLLDRKLGWDAQQMRPRQSYEDLLKAETDKREAAEKTARSFQDAEAKAKTAVKELQDQLTQANKSHDDEFKKFKDQANEELKKNSEEVKKLQEQLTSYSQTAGVDKKAQDDDKRRIEKLLKDKDTRISELKKELQSKEATIDQLRKETGAAIVSELRKDWKIVRIDSRGETAYINLGSADGVQPQLTFRIHGLGPDGLPLPKDKATAQVLKVIGEHLSQVKVMYDTSTLGKDGKQRAPRHDPRINPVLTGDVLFNPSWTPNQKKHIALAGVVDLTGGGRDDTEQFIRELERQNIVVDAYLDMRKDFTVKGPGITVQTDFLIVGDKPEAILNAEEGRKKEIAEKIDNAMKTMEKQAKDNGVRKMNLREYLNEIGYQIPGGLDRKRATIDYRGEGGSLPPPGPKNPAPPPPAAPAAPPAPPEK
jgi:hypothetical protein